jgi:hypothetical protein
VQDSSSHIQRYDLALATVKWWLYQAKLIEMTQANVQFPLDFSQRLATYQLAFQFVDVIVEFATRRAAMLGNRRRK